MHHAGVGQAVDLGWEGSCGGVDDGRVDADPFDELVAGSVVLAAPVAAPSVRAHVAGPGRGGVPSIGPGRTTAGVEYVHIVSSMLAVKIRLHDRAGGESVGGGSGGLVPFGPAQDGDEVVDGVGVPAMGALGGFGPPRVFRTLGCWYFMLPRGC
jgi:hypothetical protein